MTDIREIIADGVYESTGGYPCPTGKDIRNVKLRKGCAEIEVDYAVPYGDAPYSDTAIIDAAPVLTALLQSVIDEQLNI